MLYGFNKNPAGITAWKTNFLFYSLLTFSNIPPKIVNSRNFSRVQSFKRCAITTK